MEEDINNTRGIAAAANNNFNLTLFAMSLQYTANVATLSQPGPFTVFAPSNAAFAAAGIRSQADIVNAANGVSTSIPYHIFPSSLQLDTMSFIVNKEIKMKNGLPLYVSRQKNLRDTAITVNGIRIEQSGLQTANGTIYILEKMLAPTTGSNIQEVVAGKTNLTFFNAAVIRSGMQDILKTGNLHTVFAPSNQAFTEIGIPGTDSIYKMDPVFLKQLVESHITSGRSFVYDYIMKAATDNNEYVEKMLNGTETVVQLLPQAGRPNRFRGVALDHTNMASAHAYATISSDNYAAANGVVHIIDKLFIP
jgi:uncharacterized surface protein with fasciclin (FAS1) repeats